MFGGLSINLSTVTQGERNDIPPSEELTIQQLRSSDLELASSDQKEFNRLALDFMSGIASREADLRNRMISLENEVDIGRNIIISTERQVQSLKRDNSLLYSRVSELEEETTSLKVVRARFREMVFKTLIENKIKDLMTKPREIAEEAALITLIGPFAAGGGAMAIGLPVALVLAPFTAGASLIPVAAGVGAVAGSSLFAACLATEYRDEIKAHREYVMINFNNYIVENPNVTAEDAFEHIRPGLEHFHEEYRKIKYLNEEGHNYNSPA